MSIILYTAEKYTSFVHTEIEMLRSFQSDYRIVTTGNNSEGSMYENSVQVEFNIPVLRLWKHMLSRHSQGLLRLLVLDTFSKGTSLPYILDWRNRLSTLLRCSIIELDLFHQGLLPNEAIHYSYYVNEFTLILAIAKARDHLSSFSSRAHGRDVIETREPRTRKLPFKWFIYSSVDKVYTVSTKTTDYLQERYPNYKRKFEVSYLGTADLGIGPLIAPEEQLVIISVGRIRNVKRFYLIAEMLQFVDVPIKWVHAGDVAENDPTNTRFQEALRALNTKANVEVDMLGFVKNEDLLKHYSHHYYDLIVNTSKIEGLPVSIQEAISFGIPAMATNVGGTSDIVNETTGILLSADPDLRKSAETMIEFITKRSRSNEFRLGVRNYWEKHFDGSVNYPAFFNTLVSRE